MILKTILRVFTFAKPYRLHLIVSMITLLIVTGINIFAPMLARDLIDNNIWTNRSLTIAIILVLLYLMRGIMRAVSNTLSHYSSMYVCALIQKEVYAHMQMLSRNFYSERQSGELLTRVTNDVDQVEELISHALPDTVSNIILVVGVTAAMFFINAPLALVTVATILPVLSVGLFQKKVNKAFTHMFEQTQEQNAMMSENLQGIREIQLFGRQQHENERAEKKFFAVAKASFEAIRWYSFFSPGIEFFTALGQVIVIAAGGYMIATGNLTSGDVVAFLLYIGLFYAPVSALSNTLETIQKAAAGASRVFEVLDWPITIQDGEVSMTDRGGEITFDDVSFSYDSNELIFDRLSLHIKSGQTVALIGATGAGKTTFLNLIVRLFDPQQGKISIDGINIKDYTLESLRNNISIVSQDVFLFSGSIYDNIAYSKPKTTIEKIREAAKNAAIHEFVISLKDGYSTLIGEKGVKLSGGQRQRLALARAFLRNSPILLLDEATSAVDEETEKEIRRMVTQNFKDKTVIIVTHRLASVSDADRVIKIDKGQVVSDLIQ